MQIEYICFRTASQWAFHVERSTSKNKLVTYPSVCKDSENPLKSCGEADVLTHSSCLLYRCHSSAAPPHLVRRCKLQNNSRSLLNKLTRHRFCPSRPPNIIQPAIRNKNATRRLWSQLLLLGLKCFALCSTLANLKFLIVNFLSLASPIGTTFCLSM